MKASLSLIIVYLENSKKLIEFIENKNFKRTWTLRNKNNDKIINLRNKNSIENKEMSLSQNSILGAKIAKKTRLMSSQDNIVNYTFYSYLLISFKY